MTEKTCRKCLLWEMDKAAFQNIYDYIATLPDEIKAEGGLYNRRLQLCQECGDFVNGICRICGCFAEARAAKKQNSCPASPPAW